MVNNFATICGNAALLTYLAGIVLSWHHLFGQHKPRIGESGRLNSPSLPALTATSEANSQAKGINLNQFSPKAKLLLPGIIAVILQLIYCWDTLFQGEGLNFGLFSTLSIAGALTVIGTIVLSSIRPAENITIVVYPLAFGLLLLSLSYTSGYTPRNSLPLPILTHITLSLLAYSTFGIAFAQALLTLGQGYQLKHKRLAGLIQALPPLQLMEQILFGLIWFGLVLLSLSIATGFLFVDNLFAQKLLHKTFFTLTAWGIFTTLLIGRYCAGWRGLAAIQWSIGGFLLLAIGFIGTKLVVEIFLIR